MKRNNVLLIGESCSDIFIYGSVDRLMPDAPAPIIKPLHTSVNDGMAKNVKNNIESLGIDIYDFITNTDKILKTRYVDESYNYILLRIDENDVVDGIDLNLLPNSNDIDCVIISDYDKGLLSESDIEYILKKYNSLSFIDTKKKLGDWISTASFIKINNTEYTTSKKYIDSNLDIKEKTIITKGKYGCELNGKLYETDEVLIKDVSGAGDTFLSGLVYNYLNSNNIDESIKFANKCSTQVVQLRGVNVINKEKLNV